MNTRLTKALREEIAQAVYKASDLPARREEMKKLAKVEATKIVCASRPAGFAEVLKSLPHEWFGSVGYVGINGYIRRTSTGERLDLSTETIGDLYSDNIRFDDPVPYPVCGGGEYLAAVHEWLYDVYRPQYRAWAADRQKLMDSARALLNSYRTVEALIKAAPEMKQFIPASSVSYPPPALPISNVISTFLERGITFQTA